MGVGGLQQRPTGHRGHEDEGELAARGATAGRIRRDHRRPAHLGADEKRSRGQEEQAGGGVDRHRAEHRDGVEVAHPVGVADQGHAGDHQHRARRPVVEGVARSGHAGQAEQEQARRGRHRGPSGLGRIEAEHAARDPRAQDVPALDGVQSQHRRADHDRRRPACRRQATTAQAPRQDGERRAEQAERRDRGHALEAGAQADRAGVVTPVGDQHEGAAQDDDRGQDLRQPPHPARGRVPDRAVRTPRLGRGRAHLKKLKREPAPSRAAKASPTAARL